MNHYLSLTKEQDDAVPIAYIKNGKSKKSFIYLCNTKDGKTKPKRFIIPDSKITKYDDYIQGIFPFFENKKDQNHRLLVAGSSGSGKSKWISQVLRQISTRLEPDSDDDADEILVRNGVNQQIIIFSAVEYDEALDRDFNGKYPIRFDLKSPGIYVVEPKDMLNCIVVFDDIENYSRDKNVKKKILDLRSEMFENSRHFGTDLISVSHKIRAGNTNTTVKNECTGICIFPYHSNEYRELSTFIKDYLGYKDMDLVKYMLEMIGELYTKTRYIYIYKKNPNVIIHRNGVEIIPRTGSLLDQLTVNIDLP